MRQGPRDAKHVRTTCANAGTIGTSGSATVPTSQTYADVLSMADFIAFKALFREYRIVGMKWAITDVETTKSCVAFAGTHHFDGLPSITKQLVQDTPDCKTLRPYETDTFYWFPQSYAEKNFISTADTTNLGGLLVFCTQAATGVDPKYSFIFQAIVEFKDRV